MNPPPSSDHAESTVYAGSGTFDTSPGRDVAIEGAGKDVLVPGDRIGDAITDFWCSFKTDSDVKKFFTILVLGTFQHLDEIDQIINDTSKNWKLDRMAVVDRNIIRCAVFEILYLSDIPSTVTINEAIEIAKRYGTEDSPGFINGILDRIADEFADRD